MGTARTWAREWAQPLEERGGTVSSKAGATAPFGSACIPACAALSNRFKLWPQDPLPLFTVTEGAKERLFMGVLVPNINTC